jgi:hypothetical protein
MASPGSRTAVRSPSPLAAAFLALATAAAIVALTGFQATGPTAGERFLGRVAASMVELDRWLVAHAEDIDTAARERPAALITLGGLPLDVQVPQAAIGDDGALRAAIIEAMGGTLYEDGVDAFGDEASISMAEPSRWAIELYSSGVHGLWIILAAVAAGAVLLCAVTVLLSGGPDPIARAAIAVAIGAAIALIGAIACYAGFRVVAGMSGGVNGEVALVLRDSAWMGARNAFAILLGAAVVAIGLRILSRAQPQAQAAFDVADGPV